MTRSALPVLLLTATITPDEASPLLARRDPAVRLAEYLAALDYYLRIPRSCVGTIVFAENSGSDLSAIEALAARHGMADRVELLRLQQAPAHLGRGVGEAKIIDDAMALSPAIQALPPGGHIWKVTGRYTVRNLDKLVETAPDTPLYINLRRKPIAWCDTYAYAFTRAGYDRYLSDAAQAVAAQGEIPGEETMAVAVERWLRNGEPITPRFRREPRVDGVRGWDLTTYGGTKQRLKFAARVVARRALPNVWV